ncbi:MAG: CBS domain-containing protein [Cyclobacteriaceae bacterium]
MGEYKVDRLHDEYRAKFIGHLLRDVNALDLMIERGMIESGIRRMGAEQEFCLVKPDYSPSTYAVDVLREINDPHFTTELAVYNLEANLDPLEIKGNCFTQTHQQLTSLIDQAREAAKRFDNKLILTGILPTIRRRELDLTYLTPITRYLQLNDIMREMRGSDFSLHLRGVDELTLLHESILFEACNTSFQVHLQLDPEDMVQSYNWAQAIAGPVLSVCTNSPLLLGRELWSETRIALFQQSVDIRNTASTSLDREARVSFGTEWLKDSITNIFKDDIARHTMILSTELNEDSMSLVEQGDVPTLRALRIHNGTIYRWNRPCYGVANGKAHLRIENRYIPSGPTLTDEIANFAFWIGLMLGRPAQYDNVHDLMDFRDAKANFIKAARCGKESQMYWMGKVIPAAELIRKELLPIAYNGLRKAGVDEEDIIQYLSVIELRNNRITGSQWMVSAYRNFRQTLKRDDALKALTEVIGEQQQADKPLHTWSVPISPPSHYPKYNTKLAHEIMTTDVFTVRPQDHADLVRHVMQWKNIHHVPVVNAKDGIVGLLSSKNLEHIDTSIESATKVEDIMQTEVSTAPPEMNADEAARMMMERKIGCLPIVHQEKLVGIITRNDIVTRLQ